MSNLQEQAPKTPAIGKESKDANLAYFEKKQREIRLGLDACVEKLTAFAENILNTIEQTGKTAVFIGRDGRWLLYTTKLVAKNKNLALQDKLKFIDISRDYAYDKSDNSDYRIDSAAAEQKGGEYASYFRKLSIDPKKSFLIDVGLQGTTIHNIRETTGTADNDDVVFVKSDLNITPEVRGFYKGGRGDWDENIQMAHFLENLPQVVEPIERLIPARGGMRPKYQAKQDAQETELAQMTYQYLKKTIAESYAKQKRVAGSSAAAPPAGRNRR